MIGAAGTDGDARKRDIGRILRGTVAVRPGLSLWAVRCYNNEWPSTIDRFTVDSTTVIVYFIVATWPDATSIAARVRGFRGIARSLFEVFDDALPPPEPPRLHVD
jgi:hypothetical protein